MTTNLDIANRALQFFGDRSNMTSAEFSGQTSNEAIQSQLIMFQLRDELNRMAPWDCATKWAPLTYITSVAGTPENPSSGPPLWQRGSPAVPWAYEYQYPVDCLRACTILPQYTAPSGSVPVYPPGTVTGANNIGWSGPALKFKVGTDQFFPATAAAPASGGSGYAVGDVIQLQQPSFTFTQFFPPFPQPGGSQTYTMPVGTGAVLLVTGTGGGGAIVSVSIVDQVYGSTAAGTPFGGSYFQAQVNPQAQLTTSGAGSGATFNVTWGTAPASQRIILTNVEDAILRYNYQITDPNTMDSLFQDAWVAILAARLVKQLSGDLARANQAVSEANLIISEARKADGNEGLTVNDVMPDFLRIRGNWGGPNWEYSSNQSFDWGGFYSPY